MRHSQPGILLTLCAALAVASACTSDAGTNAVSEVDPGVFLTTRLKEKTVRLTGTIRDIVDDDLDAQWHFIVLNARHSTIYCPIRNTPRKTLSALMSRCGVTRPSRFRAAFLSRFKQAPEEYRGENSGSKTCVSPPRQGP